VVAWGESGVCNVARNLVNTQPGFLKGSEDLRIRLKALRGRAQQAEGGACKQQEDYGRNQELSEREALLAALVL
jgi:hypothetical protein